MKGWDVRRMSGSEGEVRCHKHGGGRRPLGLRLPEGVMWVWARCLVSAVALHVSSSACVAVPWSDAWMTSCFPLSLTGPRASSLASLGLVFPHL